MRETTSGIGILALVTKRRITMMTTTTMITRTRGVPQISISTREYVCTLAIGGTTIRIELEMKERLGTSAALPAAEYCESVWLSALFLVIGHKWH